MRVVLSVLFWAFVATSCLPLFVGALVVFLVTYPVDRNRRLLHLYSCAWAQLVFHANFAWKLTVEGRQRLPWRGPAVIVSNHESLGDILVLFGLYRPFKWVSKQAVFKVPLIGWNMRLNGYVPLVRGNKESVVQMLEQCEAWLRRGVPILMFPEGTRSDDGTVHAFKDGAFQLAVKCQCPVIPIALTGTGRTLPKHGLVLREAADCHVQVLEAIDPAPFKGDFGALRDVVRQRIIEAKERRLPDSPGGA